MILKKSPSAPAHSPFNIFLSDKEAITLTPKRARRKYSCAPNFNANSARGGAMKRSAKMLIKPPNADAEVASAIALPDSPF